MPNEQKRLKQDSEADVKKRLELIMLPDEIQLRIFEHLSDDSLFHCQKVSRRFQKIAKEVYCRNFKKLKEIDPSCSPKANRIRKLAYETLLPIVKLGRIPFIQDWVISKIDDFTCPHIIGHILIHNFFFAAHLNCEPTSAEEEFLKAALLLRIILKCNLAGSFISAAATDCSFGGIVHWRGATFTERSKNAVANTGVEALITKLLNLMIITELSDPSNPQDWHLNVGEFLEMHYQPNQSAETSFYFHVEGSPAIVQSLRNCVLEEDICETIYLPKDCCNCKFTLTSQPNTPAMGIASSAISLKIDIKTA